ncbi:putative Indeterminate(ID)-domain 7 [Tripterygium wilfordii]|uniref:Putative Indeterminate(ID)-domain 7 n=1 Tax=Tripterygium wilfordii TaxID=458696 RepID=A0A7J7DAA1_TRIWF|nr:protein indeterminate-domain 7-like [Tripterygium wilfordii]KAF5743188.1 putative Indeterminate(ID)-domain 7 [Tripterygium wilfordii]
MNSSQPKFVFGTLKETDGFKFVSSSTSFMMDESMSNLTSASGEVSASSGSRIEIGSEYAEAPPAKKKRGLPGNPDPDAEVIALSPKSLLATNRYVCEICNKGFRREQNLQLHRRGHNLPWKLKQRTNKEVRKKVYLCPETTCVHHNPSRALGDLTGIKKHFCRKHGEKKWKCEKCSKRYAVQTDWKAHFKICGTREYRCDCGTLFSRRDSFITHRAFCDALAKESARAITNQPGTSGSQLMNLHQLNTHGGHVLRALPVKREAEYNHLFNQKPDNVIHNIPPWLAGEAAAAAPNPSQTSLSSPLFSSSTLDLQSFGHQANQNQNPNPNPTQSHFQTPTAFPHMSATALLQKAAQMGVTMSSSKPSPSPAAAVHRPHQVHMSDQTTAGTTGGLGLSSCESGFVPNKAASGFMEQATANTAAPSSSFLHDMMTSLSSGFDGSPSFGQAFIGLLNQKRSKDSKFLESNSTSKSAESQLSRSDDSLTRDFFGLKAFSHSEFLSMVNLDRINSSYAREQQQQNQNQTPWH